MNTHDSGFAYMENSFGKLSIWKCSNRETPNFVECVENIWICDRSCILNTMHRKCLHCLYTYIRTYACIRVLSCVLQFNGPLCFWIWRNICQRVKCNLVEYKEEENGVYAVCSNHQYTHMCGTCKYVLCILGMKINMVVEVSQRCFAPYHSCLLDML